MYSEVKQMTNQNKIQLLRSLYKDGLTVDQLCDKLERGEHFTFSRFGDGEFNAIYSAMNNEPGENCDGHQYFPEMGKELGEILKAKRPYHVGLDMSERPAKVEKTVGFLVDNDLIDKQYTRSDLFHTALVDGKFGSFFDAISKKKVIVIGPIYLNQLALLSEETGNKHIVIPSSNCWTYTTDIKERMVMEDIQGKVLLFVASMAANVWIDRLYQQYADNITMIDLGSAFDPYCGRQTRSFHKRIKIKL